MKNKANLKKSWEVMKKIINKKKDVLYSRKFKISDQVVSDNKTIADHFNNFFVNIGPNLSRKILNSEHDALHYVNDINLGESIYLRSTTVDEVTRIIHELKDSSCGYDEISARVIKDTYHIYLTPLIHLINLSLAQGVFPNELKIARVVPLYKSGDSQSISNYRPISILSVFSKVFERVMQCRLLDFLDKHDLLDKSQFGFRKNHSTITALTVLIDKILTGFHNGDMTLGIYLDFSKAFDTIDHRILIRKLNEYGIRGIALKWLKEYLSNRQQYVSFNNCNSDYQSITCGVPQGSILGPLLFILYINDLPKVSEILFPILYADDSNIFIQGKKLSHMVSLLNSEMEKIADWVKANKLSLNLNKTFFMIFKTRKRNVNMSDDVRIMNHKVVRVFDIKFLGVILDCHLTWDRHVTYIRSKIAKSCGIISKTKKVLNRKTLVTLYYSFMYPYLVYAIELWGNSSKHNIDILFKIQKKVLRMICNTSYHAHSSPLFNDLNILNVHKLYQYQLSLFMYKINRNLCPSVLKLMLEDYIITHEYHTRQYYKYNLPFYRLSICQKTVKYKGIMVWNYIIDHLNIDYTIVTFKKYLKIFLINNDIPNVIN